MTRTAIFNLLLGIFIGLALAVGFAWTRTPEPNSATLDVLRPEYKIDYVVMVAQAYAADSNLDLARTRLQAINKNDQGKYVAEVTRLLITKGAPPTDLRALVTLTTALGGTPPTLP